MGRYADTPRMHRDAAFLAAKRARLHDEHVFPINELVRELRAEFGQPEIPYVDPDSAGVLADVVLLMESPSLGGVVSQRGSGMLSWDNDDPTAATLWQLLREAELPRDVCVPWNAVPWFVGTEARNAPASRQDLARAHPLFRRFVSLLEHPRVVVTLGRKARDIVKREHQWLAGQGIALIEGPHPSPQNLNTRPWLRQALLDNLLEAKGLLNQDHSPPLKATHAVGADGRLLFEVHVQGRPATFATAHEQAWKALVAGAFGDASPLRDYPKESTRYRVRIAFQTPPARTANERWDIDNLVKPTLDAMGRVFGMRGWNGPVQAADDRVDALEATKRTAAAGDQCGAHITVWSMDATDQVSNTGRP